jgi:hypothetical protein
MIAMALLTTIASGAPGSEFKGNYCSGKGDVEYLRLIDRSFEFFHPSADVPNISMLYHPEWDCLIEGSKWQAWWIQNSYGPTFCALPFLQDPWLTFLQHSQDMWFNNQGNGKKGGYAQFANLIGPDGCLCDCAIPTGAIYRQGDCNWQMHDWAFEFTAAGVLMQAELMLISRDMQAIHKYLPNLERACEFIETRRDPRNNLFLVGPAADLLAPSYGGVKQPGGTFGKGYLAAMSITYLAAIERMVELYKLTGDKTKLATYQRRCKITRNSLSQYVTKDGYFVKSIEPDGTKHGVVGQEKYGYFAATANVDAIAHHAVDKAQSERIYAQIAAQPGLRPHDFLITNYPSLDDMYDNWGSREHGSLWTYGMWVNGGAWSTVEARAILAYYRLGKYDDIRRSNLHSMRLADGYQMDAPLKDFGNSVWFDQEITNLCYDALGIPAATIRGLFEYVYKSDRVILYPHIPPSITQYAQSEPIRFGVKRITISVSNGGPRVASLKVNGRRIPIGSPESVSLAYDALPKKANVEIIMDGGWPAPPPPTVPAQSDPKRIRFVSRIENWNLRKPSGLPYKLRQPYAELLRKQSSAKTDFDKAFISEALQAFDAYQQRAAMKTEEKPEKRTAILKMYEDAAMNLCKGYRNRKSP